MGHDSTREDRLGIEWISHRRVSSDSSSAVDSWPVSPSGPSVSPRPVYDSSADPPSARSACLQQGHRVKAQRVQ